MASGKVCTGFSLPYVALYSESSGVITYTSGQKLARGVEVSVEPEASDDNIFYADNQAAESAAGTFSGGTVTLTVDGLKHAAERLIFGLPAANNDGWIPYDDDAVVPYVGIGYIARYMEDGVTSYVATVIPKAKFNFASSSHATQEDSIDWQTQELVATILRADDAKHTWKWLGAELTTEAAAEAALKTKLGIS